MNIERSIFQIIDNLQTRSCIKKLNRTGYDASRGYDGSLRRHSDLILGYLYRKEQPLSEPEKDFVRSFTGNVSLSYGRYYVHDTEELESVFEDRSYRMAVDITRKNADQFGIEDVTQFESEAFRQIGIIRFICLPLLVPTPLGDRHLRQPEDVVRQIIYALPLEVRCGIPEPWGVKELFALNKMDQEIKAEAVEELDRRLRSIEDREEKQEEAIKRVERTGVYVTERERYSARAGIRTNRERTLRARAFLLLTPEEFSEIGRIPGDVIESLLYQCKNI